MVSGDGCQSRGAVRTFRGFWWLPQHPETRVGGVLCHSASEGGQLTVFGTLLGDDRPDVGPLVLFGTSEDSVDVTVCDAVYRSQQGVPGAETVETWDCYRVLIGRLLPAAHATKFRTVLLETELLEEWAGRPHARPRERGDGSAGVVFDVPQAPWCEIPGLGTLTLRWAARVSRSGGAGSVGLCAAWHIELLEEMGLQDIYCRVTLPLLFLTTLSAGSGDRIRSLRASLGTGYGATEGVEVLDDALMGGAQSRTAPTRRRFFLRLDDLVDAFGTTLRAWFALNEATHSALLEFFSVALTPRMYAEESFSRVARSLEVWHRARHDGTYLPPAEFEALRKRVLAVASGAEKEFLAMRLQSANDLTLKKRLEAMVGLAGFPVSDLVSRCRDFPRRVTITRNSLTHEAEIGDAFTYEELAYGQMVLEYVMRAVLLKDIGVSEERVALGIRRSPDWELLHSSQNVLLRPQ